MPRPNTDRNLLIGVLALQMDFIDRDQLVAAVQEWISDKSRSLDQVLLEQGALDKDARPLLVALVDKHLEMHGGDAERSLAAASTLRSARDALEQLGDVDLEASLIHVGEQHRDEDPHATRTSAPTGEFTSQGHRFRILRPHASGGLGKVSVARDEELDREVALKEIKEKHADNLNNRSRFMVEAEITGGLEHPGIVPVYGLGQYADGRPFYAMRFIRGDSLQQAIARYYQQDSEKQDPGQRSLELRKLLGRFINVCHAIEYAHSRGVLHRDLKPGNIMLGKYGETLVVDWGLAKTSAEDANATNHDEPLLRPASASGSAATQMGSYLGTPAYMSPEQAAGRLDLLNATSDVYGLGATLYDLLTGKAPVTGRNIEELLHKVEKGEFPKPSSVMQDIPRALEAICLRAMALQPHDRYQSAAALAEDIENWLADEPVTAWKEPLRVRAGRWLRHHRTFASSAAAAVIAGLAISGVALVVISGQNVALAKANEKQTEYLRLARSAVDEMLMQVGKESLKDVPQMEDVRKELLTKARKFYERFSEETPDDARLRMEVALAWRRIADVDRIEHEVERAEAGYRESIQQLTSLLGEHKDDPDLHRELALSYRGLGLLFLNDNLDQAVPSFDTAIEIAEPFVRRPETPRSWQQELANFHYNRGIALNELGQQNDALDAYEAAIAILDRLSQSNDADVDVVGCRHELGRCYNNKARVLVQIDSREQARSFYQRATELGESVLEERPNDREVMFNVAQWNNNLANTLNHLGNGELSQEANARARELLEQLAVPLPDIANELGNARNTHAALLVDDGQLDEAERELQRAEADFRTLLRSFKDAQYKDRLSNVLYQLGLVAYRRGASPEHFYQAKRRFEEAAQQGIAALQGKPKESEYIRHLGDAYKGLSMTAWQLQQHEDTASHARKLVETSPGNPDWSFFAAQMMGRAVEIVERHDMIDDATRKQLINSYSVEAISLLRKTFKLQADADGDPVLTAGKLQENCQDGKAFFYLRDQEAFEEVKNLLKR